MLFPLVLVAYLPRKKAFLEASSGPQAAHGLSFHGDISLFQASSVLSGPIHPAAIALAWGDWSSAGDTDGWPPVHVSLTVAPDAYS